jgi:zinc finger protein ZFPM1
MRTHIRMHFDKKTVDFNEENYITCILEEDGVEISATKAPSPVVANENAPSQMHYCEMCHYSSSYKGNVVSDR